MFADQSVALDRAVIRDQVCAQMAGKGHSGYRSADHLTSRCHGPSDDPAVDSATGWRTAGSAESWCYGSVKARYTAGCHQSFNPTNQRRRCKDRSVEACGRSSRYTPANS